MVITVILLWLSQSLGHGHHGHQVMIVTVITWCWWLCSGGGGHCIVVVITLLLSLHCHCHLVMLGCAMCVVRGGSTLMNLYTSCYGSTWARSQQGFSCDSHKVFPNKTKNVLSCAPTYNAWGLLVQTRGTYVWSTGKCTTASVALWWSHLPHRHWGLIRVCKRVWAQKELVVTTPQ